MSPMNREAIQERIESLRQDHEVAKSNMIAIDGAIQDCDYWLAVLAEAESQAEECAEECAVAPDDAAEGQE